MTPDMIELLNGWRDELTGEIATDEGDLRDAEAALADAETAECASRTTWLAISGQVAEFFGKQAIPAPLAARLERERPGNDLVGAVARHKGLAENLGHSLVEKRAALSALTRMLAPPAERRPSPLIIVEPVATESEDDDPVIVFPAGLAA